MNDSDFDSPMSARERDDVDEMETSPAPARQLAHEEEIAYGEYDAVNFSVRGFQAGPSSSSSAAPAAPVVRAARPRVASQEEGKVDLQKDQVTPVIGEHEGIVRVDKVSTAGNEVFAISLGATLSAVLRSYGLLGNKHYPDELLRESVTIRQEVLAGVIDGDGCLCREKHSVAVSGKEREYIDGLVRLVRSLGLSSGKVGRTRSRSEDGVVYEGWRINFSGAELHDIPTALEYKRAPVPTQRVRRAAKDLRCASFTVVKVPHSKYHGFVLDGSRRCLMADYVVSHNCQLRITPCSIDL
jgi:hypothetical protein